MPSSSSLLAIHYACALPVPFAHNMVSPSELCPRGPWNDLLDAANEGYFDRVYSLVSSGSFDINQGSPRGYTALMLASDGGYGVIVRFLLKKGALVTPMGDNGVTALHVAAKNGYTSVATMLLAAGAEVGASCPTYGMTPLHLAAQRGNWLVMQVLIRAEADIDARLTDGATAMYLAAEAGRLQAVKILLIYGAKVFITTSHGATPLDVAVEKCHTDIVREIVQRAGIEGCGGPERGAFALRLAAQYGYTEIMAILYAAGFRDVQGVILCAAIMHGGEKAVQFLLKRSCHDTAYANTVRGVVGKPLLCCLTSASVTASSPRIMRMLIDAGADTRFTFACLNDSGHFLHRSTALQLVTKMIDEKKSGAVVFNEEQMHGLRGMRRLLVQVDAARAVSWGWTSWTSAASSSSQNVTKTLLPLVIRRKMGGAETRVVWRALDR